MIINPFAFAAPAPLLSDTIRMRFETAYPFTDEGSAGSTWTRSSANVAQSTASSPPEGSSWMLSSAAGDNLHCTWGSANRITTTGFIGGYFRPSGSMVSVYLASVQDATGTAAGTAWAWVTNGSGTLFLIYCNGTTRTVTTTGVAMTADVRKYLGIEVYGGNIYASVDGVIKITAAFTGFPAISRDLRLCAAEAGNGPGGGLYVDLFQVGAGTPFQGANFTPPTSYIP